MSDHGGGGGGAEAHARSKQYEYGANSSLVLTTGSRPRDAHEHTGEPETLSGRIDPRSFGDRAVHDRPSRPKARAKRLKRDAADDGVPRRDAKRRRRAAPAQDVSVLSLTDDDAPVYKPRTNETRAAYEALLSLIQHQLGGQPLEVVTGAADEVLATLKNDKVNNPDKKKDIEKLLNPIPSQLFDQLVSTGKLITDFHDAAAGDTTLDDDVLVAVQFEQDEDEESDFDQVQDELDEDDEDDAAELNGPGGMQIGGELDDDDDMQNANQGLAINVQDIDAYWLQRKISQAHGDGDIDTQQSQKLADDILKIIAEGDDRDVENSLLMLLDFEKFDLIKLLIHNRLKIVWCTRLARAQDQEQRKKLEEEMASDPSLAPILELLHATRASAKERQKNLEKSIRDEAKRLLLEVIDEYYDWEKYRFILSCYETDEAYVKYWDELSKQMKWVEDALLLDRKEVRR